MNDLKKMVKSQGLRRISTVCAYLFLGYCLLATQAFAQQGAADTGEALAKPCSACHGPEGNSTVPAWPKIAGQNTRYFVAQMVAYKSGPEGPRYNAVMEPMVAPLSDQQIEALADYFARQTMSTGAASPALLERGQTLYRAGDREKHIAACIACHGPRGAGNAEAGFPVLAGQHADYIVAQLEAYKHGTRRTDLNSMMSDTARRMSTEEMQAVASYIAGLH